MSGAHSGGATGCRFSRGISLLRADPPPPPTSEKAAPGRPAATR